MPNHEDTSKEAFASIQDAVERMRTKIYRHIVETGGATCAEVESALGMLHQTASARIRELVVQRQIRKSGNYRPTPRARRAHVWIRRPPPRSRPHA